MDKKFKYQAYHYRAIELKYQGLIYRNIGERLAEEFTQHSFHEKKIARWFMSGGILEQLYMDYVKKENHRRRQEIRQKFTNLVADVPDALKEVLNKRIVRDPFGNIVKGENGLPAIKYDSTTVKAAVAILQAAGVEMDQKDDDAFDEILERIEELDQKQRLNDKGEV